MVPALPHYPLGRPRRGLPDPSRFETASSPLCSGSRILAHRAARGVLHPPVAKAQSAEASPAARPVAQAQTKLCPPIGPNASSIPPQPFSPLQCILSSERASTSDSATPPPVTSAFLYPSSPLQGRSPRTIVSMRRNRSSRRNSESTR